MKLDYYQILTYMVFVSFSCDDPNSPSDVWDPSDVGRSSPYITNIEPPDRAYAGSQEITIFGGNFGDNKDSTFVYFNTGSAEIISIEESSIIVVPPNIISDSVIIKVAAQGAFSFGIYDQNYTLYPRILEYGDFDAIDESVWGLEVDNDENLYVGLSVFPEGTIDKITPPMGNREYSFISAVLQTPYSMRIGPENSIYYVDGVNPYIIKQELSTGSPSYAALPGIAFDLDFDENGNFYCGGSGQNLYKVTTNLSSSVAADYADISIRAVRVFNGFVYVGGNYSGTDSINPNIGIWKNQILSSDGELGEKEVVLNWEEFAGSNSNITCITFDENGTMYISSDANIGIGTYSADGKFSELYPKIIFAPIAKMTWGSEKYLYLNYRGDPRAVYRFNMDVNGAPYYGRN